MPAIPGVGDVDAVDQWILEPDPPLMRSCFAGAEPLTTPALRVVR